MTAKRLVTAPKEEPPTSSAERTEGSDSDLKVPERAEGAGSEPKVLDLRSPLERFRTKPKKPLSVTDLISPSWCELQYWYTLTKYGKKKTTPAMRQGSVVHQKLEHEVHRPVRVETKTLADAWGLKIWNNIQGLRTLRETGMTRELSVWGIIEGQVVGGVIDELSYICPDRELEAASGPTAIDKKLPEDQLTIADFFKKRSDSTAEGNRGVLGNSGSLIQKTSSIYLTDVKTRGMRNIPQGASFRPTLMQLMLYHRLLSDQADNRTDPTVLFDRYGLRPNASLSDAFVAQLAAINDEDFDNVPSESPSVSGETQSSSSTEPRSPSTTLPEDIIQLLLSHKSLHQLWTLMTKEFALTMPKGAASIGSVLKVEYRTPTDGSIMGTKTFLHDNELLQAYVEDGLRWWKGEREARGVCVEEAYKCGYCEFAEGCDWRKNKIEAATIGGRRRLMMRRLAEEQDRGCDDDISVQDQKCRLEVRGNERGQTKRN